MFRSLAALFFTLALAATSTARTRESIHFAPIPPLKQCKPTTISWAGGTGPYLLSIASVESNKTDSYAPSLAFILQFGDLTTTTFVWNTGFPVGSALVFTIMDQTDKSLVNRTDTLTIQDGMSDACLPQVVGPIAYASNVTTSGLTLAPVPIVTPTSTASLWKATMSPSPTASASQASVRTTSGARGVAVAAGVMGSLFGIAVLLGVGCFLRRKRSVARSRRAIMSGMSFDVPNSSRPVSVVSEEDGRSAQSVEPPVRLSLLRMSTLTRAWDVIRAPASLMSRRASRATSTAPSSSTPVTEVPSSRRGDEPAFAAEKYGDPALRQPSQDLGIAILPLSAWPVERSGGDERRVTRSSIAIPRAQTRSRATDGGVRLAGGPLLPVGTRPSSSGSSEDSMLPPPYRLY